MNTLSRKSTPLTGQRSSSSVSPGVIIALCAILATGAWSLWPLGALRAASSALAAIDGSENAASNTGPTTSTNPSLDTTAFRTPIWVVPPPPPPPPTPPAPPPPPPPLKLQLIAIRNEEGRLVAIVFDPDQNKLLSLVDGETIAGRTVERVTPLAVELRGFGATQALSLKPGNGLDSPSSEHGVTSESRRDLPAGGARP